MKEKRVLPKKINITRFKSMEIALEQLRPFMNQSQLHSGRQLKRFGGLRPREILGNWLMCAALNSQPERRNSPLVLTTDPGGGDGLIYDEKEQTAWPTEHVMVPAQDPGKPASCEGLIAAAVEAKQSLGKPYATGKVLIVFLAAGGDRQWSAERAAQLLPQNHFKQVWVVGLDSIVTLELIYSVTLLEQGLEEGDALPVFQVRVHKVRTQWSVVRIQ